MGVFVPMTGLNETRGVAQDSIAALEVAGRGLPASLQSRLEQLVGRWLAGPDGDRRQAAESGGVEREVARIGKADEDVMRVLVHRDDFVQGGGRLDLSPPLHHLAEQGDVAESAFDPRTFCFGNTRVIVDGKAHGVPS